MSNFPTTARSLKGCSKAWISKNYSVVHSWIERMFCKSLWINYFLPHSQRQETLPKARVLKGSEWFPYSCRLSLHKTWTWPGWSPLAALIFTSACLWKFATATCWIINSVKWYKILFEEVISFKKLSQQFRPCKIFLIWPTQCQDMAWSPVQLTHTDRQVRS